jgi:hypothetical protein
MQNILIDNRNFEQHALKIISQIKASSFVGLDCETQDDNRHEGLNALCNYNPVTRKKAANSKTVFDMRRTIMTGFSLWPEGADEVYYINLNHADVENRLTWDKAKLLLDALSDTAYWVAHNAAYELTAFASCYNFGLPRYICTMQMAVSAFGPDEYPIEAFIQAGQGGIKALLPDILKKAMRYDPDSGKMPADLEELVGKITAKESTAAHSYNGFVNDIAYGYGLKRLVKSFFGHKMTTFQEVLGTKAHMGQLTGAEVVNYGADDAYWAVRLFRELMAYMAKNCPQTIETFFNQENPMVEIFSDIWVKGMRVNTDAIWDRRDEERAAMANILRELKKNVKALLPFADEPNKGLMDEAWYAKNYKKYRDSLAAWAKSADETGNREGRG